ncbi:MAG: serine--glyoxylate aminotransferase, partial [Hyphomicrobiaceae bacterium]|nr:serine--glyoxylate aminotransferase [Hyphomicrobiaceae bacterium]
AVFVPDGHDANAMRRLALSRYNLSLGQGLGPLAGRLFRIGHLGDMNEPMLLGALATIELALKASGIPHKSGGTEAAIAALVE